MNVVPIAGRRKVTTARESDGRLLACSRCLDIVRVYEIPRPWIDPARYVCGDCAARRLYNVLPEGY